MLRRVCDRGLIRWRRARVLAGYGLAGEVVRIEDLDHLVNVYFADTLARGIPTELIRPHAIH